MEEEDYRHVFRAQAQKVWHNVAWKAAEDRQEDRQKSQCTQRLCWEVNRQGKGMDFESVNSLRWGKSNLFHFSSPVLTGVAWCLKCLYLRPTKEDSLQEYGTVTSKCSHCLFTKRKDHTHSWQFTSSSQLIYHRDIPPGLKTFAVGSNTVQRDCLTEDEKLLTNVSLEIVPKFQSLRWFLQHAWFQILARISFMAGPWLPSACLLFIF